MIAAIDGETIKKKNLAVNTFQNILREELETNQNWEFKDPKKKSE